MNKLLCSLCAVILCASANGQEPFIVISGSEAKVPKQPQACVDGQGIAHVTFGIGNEVYYCDVKANQQVDPRPVFTVANMSLGMRRGPRIATSRNTLVITAIGGPNGKGSDGDVLAYRSTDAGRSWLGPVRVNDVEASAREGLHAMTTSDDGVLWCVWLDLREKTTQLFAAKSVDEGATWSKNILVYRSPDRSICECCHPSVVANGESVHVLFRNSINGNRDMFLISSHDYGATFGNAVRLGQNHWRLEACPMDGGMLAVNEANQVSTVWRRDRSVFNSGVKSISETFVAIGEQPWIASDGKEFYMVWTSQRDGDLLLQSTGDESITSLGAKASFPVIASNSQTKAVFAFWEAKAHDSISILGIRVK